MADETWVTEAFLDQSPACHWLLDENLVFQAAYGDSTSFFGVPAPELRGRNLAAVLDQNLAEVWAGRVVRAFAGEVLRLRERREKATWNISLFPIRKQGRILFAGAMASEITPWGTAEQELRQTVLSALKAQEFERRMASQFLHDSVGQNMTALGLQLDLVRMDLEQTAPDSSSPLAEIQKLLEAIMEQVRDYSYELNPSVV